MNKNVLIIMTLVTLSLIFVAGISVFVISRGRSDRKINNSENTIDQDLDDLSEDDFADFTYEELISETESSAGKAGNTNTTGNTDTETTEESEIESVIDELDKQMMGINETSDFGDFSTTELEQ